MKDYPSEFVLMPMADGSQYRCTNPSCRPKQKATSGCLNCGAGRCPAHPTEPHISPCSTSFLPAGLRFIPDDNGGHMIDDAGQTWIRK